MERVYIQKIFSLCKLLDAKYNTDMNLMKYIESTFDKQKRGMFDTIYIMVDIHNTILVPSFEKEETFKYFNFAKETLKLLSEMKNVKLIMWSSLKDDKTDMYLTHFRENGIIFDYVNCNPELKQLPYASFTNKFYYDIGIDDKFGFEAEEDWYPFFKFLNDINHD